MISSAEWHASLGWQQVMCVTRPVASVVNLDNSMRLWVELVKNGNLAYAFCEQITVELFDFPGPDR
jgi:hypothetical protein